MFPTPEFLHYPTPDDPIGKYAWGTWSSNVIQVVATAKALAAPGAHIEPEHLLLAFESVGLQSKTRAWLALVRVGIQPSAVLGRPAPEACPPQYLCLSEWEFGSALSRVFPALVIEEAIARKDDYVGFDHLLLFLARIGVPGVDLPYERIRKAILEIARES